MCQRLYHLLVFYHIHFFLSMSLYKIQILGFKSNYNTSWQAFNERFVFELLMESAVFSFNHICCRLLICFIPASYVICIPPDAFYIFSWLCRKWWFLWYPSNLISLDSFRFLMTSFHLSDTHPDLCNGQHDLFRSLSVSPLNLLSHQFIVQPVIRYRSIYLTIVIQQSFDLSTCINIQITMEFPVLPVDIITYIVS